jgi:hypothetical protein
MVLVDVKLHIGQSVYIGKEFFHGIFRGMTLFVFEKAMC